MWIECSVLSFAIKKKQQHKLFYPYIRILHMLQKILYFKSFAQISHVCAFFFCRFVFVLHTWSERDRVGAQEKINTGCTERCSYSVDLSKRIQLSNYFYLKIEKKRAIKRENINKRVVLSFIVEYLYLNAFDVVAIELKSFSEREREREGKSMYWTVSDFNCMLLFLSLSFVFGLSKWITFPFDDFAFDFYLLPKLFPTNKSKQV